MPTLTVSGNEITDATRGAATQGDGRATPDSSFGIWEATTNLCTNGGAQSNTTGWSIGNSDWATSPGGSLARDATAFKFGGASFKITPDNLSTNEGIRMSLGASGVGTVYTASFWHNAPTGVSVKISLGENAQNKLSSATFFGNGTWQRVTVSWTGTGNAMFVWAYIGTQTATPVNFDGIQVEAKAFATPYVETNGATATRAAARVQAPTSLIGGGQGWVAARLRMGVANTAAINQPSFSWSNPDGTDNNRIEAIYVSSTAKWETRRVAAGAAASKASVADTFNPGDFRTVVMAWDATKVYLSVAGAVFVSAVNGGVPSGITTFDIGRYFQGGDFLDGDVMWACGGTGTLTDADAATLNALGNTDPRMGTLGSAAQTSFVWGADDGFYSPFVGSDSGVGSGAATLIVKAAAADSGHGGDAVSGRRISTLDASLGVDASLLAGKYTATETATASIAGTLHAALVGTQTGTASASASLKASLLGSQTGALADAAANHAALTAAELESFDAEIDGALAWLAGYDSGDGVDAVRQTKPVQFPASPVGVLEQPRPGRVSDPDPGTITVDRARS